MAPLNTTAANCGRPAREPRADRAVAAIETPGDRWERDVGVRVALDRMRSCRALLWLAAVVTRALSRRRLLPPWLLLALCLGLGQSALGLLAPSAASAAGPLHWSLPRVVEPKPASKSQSRTWALSGVSCPSASLCVGFDSGGNVVSSTQPESATRWTVSKLDFFARGMSCPSVSLCVAVGGIGRLFVSTNPTGDAAAWTSPDIDPPPDGPRHSLTAVSCPSASFCAAVDDAGHIFTTTDPTGGPGAWTVRTVSPSAFGDPLRFQNLSCASAALCVAGAAAEAGDAAGSVAASSDPAGDANAWTVSRLPAHSDTHGQGIDLTSLSCPSVSLCVAGSFDGRFLSSTAPTSGVWTLGSIAVGGVWCESQTLCFASGATSSGGNTNPQLLQSTDPAAGKWSVSSSFWPFGVSCPSASLCFAVGASPNDSTVANQVGGTVVVGTADAVKPSAVAPPKLYHKRVQIYYHKQVTAALDLACEPGAWSGTTPLTVHDEILRDGRVLKSSVPPSASTYLVRSSYLGHAFACREVAANSAGSVAVTSAAFVPGGPGKSKKPTAPNLVVSCRPGSGQCTITVTMSVGKTNVGKVRLSLPAGQRRQITLKLNRAGGRLLAKRHKITVTLAVTTAQPHHHPSTVTHKKVFTT